MDILKNGSEFEMKSNDLREKFRKWEFIRDFSHKRVFPIDSDEIFASILSVAINMGIFIAFAFVVLLVTICSNQGFGILKTFGIAFVCYEICFLILWMIGKVNEKKYNEELSAVETELNDQLDKFYSKKYKDSKINQGCIIFENGVIVSVVDKSVCIPLNGDYGKIEVYHSYCPSERMESGKRCELNEVITSTVFNEKFRVVTDTDNKRRGLSYLTPSAQVALMNLYSGTDLMNVGEVIFYTDGKRAIFDMERKHFIKEFEKVDLHYGKKLNLKEIINGISMNFESAAAEAYRIYRRFDSDLRALRGNN